ncbi:hypothetical protein DFR67_102366 [Williamsia limnetica]|uniref:Serine aminopeptidase S33 family n=1 Tax=Williamsia limnetica TaxID=882452 RepID=A0A318RS34_WILLI|nr:hypothetical protein [Williamsia limnetica]PYE20228.1 hypothetical protein DFR67_102366 [Williamsia limnetica]
MSDLPDTTSLPTYFGPAAAPLFGVVHLPVNSQVRGGVVMCAPLGKEQADTTRGMKYLGEVLARMGFFVLRFDYACTGESSGSQESPEAAGRWLDSIDIAVSFVRAHTESVSLVGLRAGALLGGQNEDLLQTLDALVLWDPVVKGRPYVRGQTALHNLSVGSVDADDPRVHLVGTSLAQSAADALARMHLTAQTLARGPKAMLCGIRDTDVNGRFATELEAAGAEVFPIGDPTPFVASHTVYFEFPVAVIERIAQWFDTTVGTETHSAVVTSWNDVVLPESPMGLAIRKSIHTLDDGTIVWITEPDSERPSDAPLLVAHSTANDIRTGPARLWAELAELVARRGGRAVRYDRYGVGETSPVDPIDDFSPLHTTESVGQAQAVTEFATVGAPSRVVHAGVCSGSWLAAHIGKRGPQSRVVMVNPLMWRLRATAFDTTKASAIGAGPSVSEVVESTGPDSRLTALQMKLRERFGPLLRAHMPYAVVNLLGVVGVVQAPKILLSALAKRGVTPDLIFSPWDYERFILNRGPRALETLGRRGRRPNVRVCESGDHPAMHWLIRESVVEVCLDALGLAPDGLGTLGGAVDVVGG